MKGVRTATGTVCAIGLVIACMGCKGGKKAEKASCEPGETLEKAGEARRETLRARRGTIADRDGRPLAMDTPTGDGSYERVYPEAEVASHIVGWASGSGEGGEATGLERSLDDLLAGAAGYRWVTLDASGNPLPVDEARGTVCDPLEEGPQAGHDVVTTIDASLMDIIHAAFEEHESGAAVVMDVETGEILALYSRPGFDPGAASKAALGGGIPEAKAMQGQFSPGSTMKTLTTVAALENDAILADELMECTGSVAVGDETLACHGQHGVLDVRTALVVSCNAFFYQLGDRLGADPLLSFMGSLGLGEPTGIEHVEESAGILPPAPGTDDGRVLVMSLATGHGALLVTPLQLAVAYASILNGGHVMRPMLVLRVLSPTGDVVESREPEELRRVDIGAETRALVIDALSAVVSDPEGTAHGTWVEGLDVGGKTGTASSQSVGESATGGEEADVETAAFDGWFVAFKPADDPRHVGVFLVEGGGTGGDVAAPIAMHVFSRWKGPTVPDGESP